MKQRGRPVLGAVSGFFLGLFVGLDLLFFGVVPLDSAVITVAPVVGLVLGVVLAFAAPLGRSKVAATAGASAAPQQTWSAPAQQPPTGPPPAAQQPPTGPPPAGPPAATPS